jgi:predicted Zn-dependent protease
MKYVAKIVDEEDNYSQDSEWWYGIRIFVRLILVVLAVYMFLGIVVDFFVPFIPVSWEDSLSGPIMAEVKKSQQPSEKYSGQKIQQLLDKIAKNLDKEHKRNFTVLVVAKKETNALALPGGNIVLYTQLLGEIESENELAMILAHELGHFAHRDHLRGLGRSFLFFMVSTVFLGNSNSAVRSLMNSSGILTNTYSRSQERKADEFALQLLVKTYGHAGGALDFFKKLQGKEQLPELAHYLSTHPAAKYRIKTLNNLIKSQGYKVAETLPVFWRKAEVQ